MKHDLFTLRIESSEHGMIGNSTVACRRCMKEWLVLDNEVPEPKFLDEACNAVSETDAPT
jgi:hypothetical protein